MINTGFDLFLLFAVSFLAATILPAQSEILLGALYLSADHSPYILLAVASVGNILGSCANWLIGRYLRTFQDKKWFRINKKAMAHATTFYQKYGVWTLLLAWVPFIGDPLTIVAGVLKADIRLFVVLVSIGKIARYIVTLYLLGFRF